MNRPEEQLHRSIVQWLADEPVRYDPQSGWFTWTTDRLLRGSRVRAFAGSRAGTVNAKGYRSIQIKCGAQRFGVKEHRLAWFLVHGEWPAEQIDHINGDRADNRIANLRLANNSQNMANRKRNEGCTLPKGVSLRRGRFVARIQVDGRRKEIGSYATVEDAAQAYAWAARMHFGQFARPE